MKAFINPMRKFLPEEPVCNDTMQKSTCSTGGSPSRVRKRIRKQSGVKARHYAINRQQNAFFWNAEMAAMTVRNAIERVGLELNAIDFLGAATSPGDLPLPSFASTVHGELKAPPCEIATLHCVCASALMAECSALQSKAFHGTRSQPHFAACLLSACDVDSARTKSFPGS